jgi:hypothetical protein
MCVLCLQVGQQLSEELRRAIYPELLKRLDDSSNKVGAQHWQWKGLLPKHGHCMHVHFSVAYGAQHLRQLHCSTLLVG